LRCFGTQLWQRLIVAISRYLGGWGNIGEFTKLLALDSLIPTDCYGYGCNGGAGGAGLERTNNGAGRKMELQ